MVQSQVLLGPRERPFVVMGPVGELEGIVSEPEGSRKPVIGMVVCHPHSLHGGAMQNKVVTTVVRAGMQLGVIGVRFNFRGVGNSEGEYAEGVGEQFDLRAVIDWFTQAYGLDELWLAGFSFGSYVAASVASSSGATQCLSIAPPVHHFDFTDVKRGHFRWLVIQGSEDEIVNAHDVEQWFSGLSGASELIQIPEAGHFFHGQLVALRRCLVENLPRSC